VSTNPALEQFIRSIPLFSLVTGANMAEVLRLLRPVELNAGDVLFREGEPGKALWILGDGAEVSISTGGAHKKPVVVAYAKKGDVLGEMSLVDDGPRSGSATVTQGGLAHQIDAMEFHAMRSTFTPAAFQVLRQICLDLCKRIRATNERIVPSANSKVATAALLSGVAPTPESLDEFAAFRGMPAVVKLALAQKLKRVDLDGLTPIFAEGEASDGAYFVVEGEVSVGRNGKTLSNLPAGTMFGIVACLDNGPRSASCVTTGPARLLKMTVRDFDALFASGHRFAYQLVDLVARQLVQHVRDANQLLPLPGKRSGPAKMAKPLETPLVSADEAAAVVDAAFGLELDTPIELTLETL
jgi:CRP-like cAMP-binding protein